MSASDVNELSCATHPTIHLSIFLSPDYLLSPYLLSPYLPKPAGREKGAYGKAVSRHKGRLTGVELEGLEPSSKRGNGGLSTCVFLDWFSCAGRPRTANLRLILRIFGASPEAGGSYSRLANTTGSINFGTRVIG